MLMHDGGIYLTQQLRANYMTNCTPYQISYKYVANADNQKGQKYKFQVGDAEFGTGYFSSNECSASTMSVQTFTTTFVTPGTIVSQPWIQLYRSANGSNNQKLDYVDEFILVAATGGGIGITGATGASYLAGSAIAPDGAFAANTSYSLASTCATSLVTNGTFDSNANGWNTTTGASGTGVASNQAGAFTVPFWENWKNSAYTGKMYQTAENVPNGTYKLNICAFVNTVDANKGQYVYANGNKTYVYTTTPTAYTVYTYVTDNTLEYGLRQDNEVANWMGIDNVSLEYCGSSDVTTDGYLAIYNAAPNHLNDGDYANVTGSEKTALQTAVNATPTATADGYAQAAFAIGYADATFTAAKQNYDEYYYENETATRLGTDVTGVTTVTSAATALTAAHEINVLNYAQVAGGGYTDVSATVLGAWTDTNVNSAQKGQHWDGTGSTTYFEQNSGYWSSDPWSMSRSQTVRLAAGSYILKGAVRAKSTADATITVAIEGGSTYTTMSGHHGDTGLGITTSGESCYTSHDTDDTKVYANSNNGRGWEWKYVPFTLEEEADVTLTFSASCAGVVHSYIGFSDLAILTETLTAAKTELLTAINNATAITTAHVNVGENVFQIPTSAKTTLEAATATAQSVYDSSSDTEAVTEATATLNTAITAYGNATLNAPTSGQRIKIVNTTASSAFDFSGNALTFYANPSQTEGGYSFQYRLAPNDAYAQNFIFTAVEGEGKNNVYTISFIDTDGTTRYVCSQKGYYENDKDKDANRIRTTTNSTYALEVRVDVTSTAGVWKLYNTEAEKNIGTNGKDNSDFFSNNDRSDLALSLASEASVTVAAKAGKYGTVIFPFTPDVSTGFDDITFYSCAGVNAETSNVQMEEIATPAANTPYLIKNEGSSDFSETLSGWGTATADSYTGGLLTGVYTTATIAASVEPTADVAGAYRYVLQTQGEGESAIQAFYKVNADFTATAYKAFLTVPVDATGAGDVKAFFLNFEDTPTGIEGIGASQSENAQIYNLAGQRLDHSQFTIQNSQLKRGLYIVGGKKVLVK